MTNSTPKVFEGPSGALHPLHLPPLLNQPASAAEPAAAPGAAPASAIAAVAPSAASHPIFNVGDSHIHADQRGDRLGPCMSARR